MEDFWAHVFFLLSLIGLGIVQTKAIVLIACWAYILWLKAFWPLTCQLLHCVCHCLILPLLLITPWAYWLVFLSYKPIDPLILSFGLPQPIYYIFTSYHFLWACWSLFLPCQPIVFTTLFLGLPQPIYFFFTSSYSHGFIA